MSAGIHVAAGDCVFVLTGAGISAESGLPTFRDSDGLWSGHRVEDVATPEAWEANPELVWRFYSMRRRDAQRSEPNPAHHAFAALESQIGDRFFLCTQNVDDLHERAGSRNLVHMHGELFSSRCESECGAAAIADKNLYESITQIPTCSCGARIRPNIVWFGEYPLEMDRIMREIDRCSVMVVVGTSGNVHPAASFVHWANQRNLPGEAKVRTYYIGPEPPLNASAFTEVILGKAGEVLPGLFTVEA
ncbi:NAD-dependent deacylase [Alloacidobacterium sp.]|uniref:SIR2 family NAD-dependent protein deacylase n=1 Tax=Alloacidobacterium sp. TaxID=2951999 RepID=UPI002D67E72E|nr:NAD-dependent deacylase [Alloacidobacterium sp.]HYK36897.1 NAD-dependent deacylase [Alloacidobacterium sp.]